VRRVIYIRAPKDLSPHLKGLYERVARHVGVDASYVKQVALGERDSSLVVEALTHELTRIAELGTKNPTIHEAQFYLEDKILLDHLVPFIAAALHRGDPAVVVATKSHQDALVQRLTLDGLDMEEASNAGRYVAVDAIGTLSVFMVNDMPEPARFFRIASGVIEESIKTAKTTHPRLAVFGEWVSVLCNRGNAVAAIRLEELWNQLTANYDLDLLCGYEMGSMNPQQQRIDFKNICAEHTGIHIQEKL
jgi:hypothetical protein